MGERRDRRLVQQSIPQATVEALDEAVLLGFARGNLMPFDKRLIVPTQDDVAGELAHSLLTIIAGWPRAMMRRSGSRATRTPDSDVSANKVRHARVQSSRLQEHGSGALP